MSTPEEDAAASDYLWGILLGVVVAGVIFAAIGCAHTQEAIAALPAGWGESTLALLWAIIFDIYALLP